MRITPEQSRFHHRKTMPTPPANYTILSQEYIGQSLPNKVMYFTWGKWRQMKNPGVYRSHNAIYAVHNEHTKLLDLV